MFEITFDPSWDLCLRPEFKKPYLLRLQQFLAEQRANGKTLFPPAHQVFKAFELTPFEQVKVVILGQDPYHGAAQAMGLAFSVNQQVPWPPSLRNIFKELTQDMACDLPTSGDLSKWAVQGVLLLNSVLTVEQGLAASHQGQGWENFTDVAIRCLAERRENLVFILWGAAAQKKAAQIDRNRHLVLESVHPSPLSSHRGFFGSKPFSQANDYLRAHGQVAIDWSLRGD